MGATGSGNFLVSMIIDPSMPFRENIRFHVGKGAIFVNEEVTVELIAVGERRRKRNRLPEVFKDYMKLFGLKSNNVLDEEYGGKDIASKNISFESSTYAADRKTPRHKSVWFEVLSKDNDLHLSLSPSKLLHAEFLALRNSSPKAITSK
jgi:hypothetical protein